MSSQVLFWIFNIFIGALGCINFPFMSKLKPGYPFNNLKGKVCSGNGIHSSLLINRENSLHLTVIVLCICYITFGIFFKLKTAKVFKKFSPGGSGRVFNSKYRFTKKNNIIPNFLIYIQKKLPQLRRNIQDDFSFHFFHCAFPLVYLPTISQH